MRMPPLPADFIHARACKLKCEKILTRPVQTCNHCIFFVAITRRRNLFLTSVKDRFLSILTVIIVHRGYGVFPARSRLKRICNS